MAELKNETGLEAYEPPVVEDVPLHSEEQVLAGCKKPGQGGPGSFIPNCRFATCRTQTLS